YKPAVDQKEGRLKSWNIARLSSRENPLVIFTLAAQAAAGAFALLFFVLLFNIAALAPVIAAPVSALIVMTAIALIALGLFMSTIHLGKPLRFYRGFNNLRHSPVSREGLGIVLFMTFAGLHFLAALPGNVWVQEYVGVLDAEWQKIANIIATSTAGLAVISSAVALYYMYRCYRIKARPFWDHKQTAFSFAGTVLNLGSAVVGVFAVPYLLLTGASAVSLLTCIGTLMAIGMAVEAVGLYLHAHELEHAEHEGAVSFYIQLTTFGKTYIARNAAMALNAVAVLVLALLGGDDALSLAAWVLVLVSVLVTALVGRALFYVLVVPTTMPGAFFWKNKAFEQHARDIGLADMPQVGVVPLKH
ncbi:MAG TPA: dimethyl sulfoxide reductase anchor subunit, partial [Pseudomonadales bacterium]|nr:dimethyl sulfoxide reductase anchor subunit [Pseudomonadales bacterium]